MNGAEAMVTCKQLIGLAENIFQWYSAIGFHHCVVSVVITQ